MEKGTISNKTEKGYCFIRHQQEKVFLYISTM